MTSRYNVSISRRSLIRAAVSAGVVSTGFAGVGAVSAADGQVGNTKGLVSVYKLGSLTFHNFMAPSHSAVVTTQIIETPKALHVIDTQFVLGIAKEARQYIDSLGKPIAKVYLSHWHPDHLLGASQFSDVPFVTSADVQADCEANRQVFLKRKEQFGDDTPLALPDGSLELGEQDWDGVPVVISQVDDCESEHTLTFQFPDAGLMIVQDLMFNNAHAFPLGNQGNWISTLEGLRETEGLKLIGCGHGLPATVGAVTDSIAYLQFQKAVFGNETDAEGAIEALKSQFPHFEGQGSLRFINALYS